MTVKIYLRKFKKAFKFFSRDINEIIGARSVLLKAINPKEEEDI